MHIFFYLFCFSLSLAGIPGGGGGEEHANKALLAPKHEFRAVWVTTAYNLDWPSTVGLSTSSQKQEFSDLLDRMQNAGMNAIIVQVRPSGDAFYNSKYAPWSYWLNGRQGKAPNPFYDPMEFMIEEAHKRNMEFHAWLNPFRAVSHKDFSSVTPDHISKKKPHWFFTYGNSIYFDPGIPAVRNYLKDIVIEIVENYDVDGIHFDDYFYPYHVQGENIDDLDTYERYNSEGLHLSDWRRSNVDRFVRDVNEKIKERKPHVKFGVSPAPVWRTNVNDPVLGCRMSRAVSCYDELYADTRKWLQEGWVDYMAPQLYMQTFYQTANYGRMLDWWATQSSERHIYVGHAAYKFDVQEEKRWTNPGEIPKQVRMTRTQPAVAGSIFFRARTMLNNPFGMTDSLHSNVYRYPALIPPMPWLDSIPPGRPRNVAALRQEDNLFLTWEPPEADCETDTAAYYLIYKFSQGEEVDMSHAAHIVSLQKNRYFTDYEVSKGRKYTYVISAVDRSHNESLKRLKVVITY